MTNKQQGTDPIDLGTIADTNFPRTHFFYEYEGEQVLTPDVLVENGILLWHEQMLANGLHDVSPLWAFSERLLSTEDTPPTHSRLEWLRFQIVVGSLTPDSWNSSKPYPYKGLLISALYFQEARRLCSAGDAGRVWHILTLAYYNLGLNTTSSASHAFATYAAKEKAEDSEYKRAIVLQVLKRLEGDQSITSIAKAKKAVVSYIQDYKNKEGKYVLLNELEKLDRLTPGNSKHSDDHDAMDRLANTLNSWASRSGPYPEMADAFAVFDRSVVPATLPEEPESNPARTTSESFKPETKDYHTRIFNLLSNGDMLSLRFAHDRDN